MVYSVEERLVSKTCIHERGSDLHETSLFESFHNCFPVMSLRVDRGHSQMMSALGRGGE